MKYTFVPLVIQKNSHCQWTRLTIVSFYTWTIRYIIFYIVLDLYMIGHNSSLILNWFLFDSTFVDCLDLFNYINYIYAVKVTYGNIDNIFVVTTFIVLVPRSDRNCFIFLFYAIRNIVVFVTSKYFD